MLRPFPQMLWLRCQAIRPVSACAAVCHTDHDLQYMAELPMIGVLQVPSNSSGADRPRTHFSCPLRTGEAMGCP